MKSFLASFKMSKSCQS